MPRRFARRARRHRVRRPGHAALQEPLGRRPAPRDPQPQPPLRPALRRSSASTSSASRSAEGGEDVGRPAGAARADAGAGAAAAAPRARRADGDARPARPARLHGDGDDGGRRRRRLGRAVLARPRRARAGRRLPRAGLARAASRWPARSTISSPTTGCSPARPPKSSGMHERLERRARQPRRGAGSPARPRRTAPPTRCHRDGRRARSPWKN